MVMVRSGHSFLMVTRPDFKTLTPLNYAMFYTYLMLQTVSYQSADLMIVEAMSISKRVDADYLMPRIRL